MSFGLKKEHLKSIKQALKRYSEIEKVLVFGSRAKHSNRAGSDIDLALKGNNISHKNLLTLKKDLTELNLPYKFDVVIYSKIGEPNLKEHIDRVGKEFFNSSESVD